jgi:membrane-anchored glycerophosphoryl diester phosphodiesterase (GDPDase)
MIGIVVMIGFLLLIVPGAILTSALAVAPSALVVEGLSASEAMNRSWNLTKGHRWKVFWTMVVAVVLIYAVTLSAGVIAGVISNLLGAAPLIAVVLATALGALLSLFVYPFMYAAVTVLYYDLRVRKEGFDLEMLESQLEGK